MTTITATPTPLDILKETYGYEQFRDDQAVIIDHIIGGGDALVIMPTGSGKSLCYQIPAMLRPGVGIVVSPLIALMADQVAALTMNGVKAAFINSTLSAAEAAQLEQGMRNGEFDLIYVAPERLCTDRFLSLLAQCEIALFAIDEAHCVSQWGHDFRPEYRALSVLHERFPKVPRLALTATADSPTRFDIIDRLHLSGASQFIGGFDRPNIKYTIVPKAKDFIQLKRWLKAEHSGDSGIVYCMSRAKTERITEQLVDAGFNALTYHAGMDRDERNLNQARFLREDGVIMVATIAFGMGIDKPDVRFVAHLDLPKSIESYYQETGRSGRDGLPAEAWMTYSIGDAVKIRGFIDDSEAPEEQKRIEHTKLNSLIGFAETTRCRRQLLLEYFGDELDKNCGNCDTCTDPPKTYDGTVEAQKALSNAVRTNQIFGATHLADVLMGSKNQRVMEFRHDELSTYGIGADKSKEHWLAVYRQLIALGHLSVEHKHGSLKLTDIGWEVCRGNAKVQLSVWQALKSSVARTKSDSGAAWRKRKADTNFSDPADQALYDVLRDHRAYLAELPPTWSAGL